MKEIKELLLRIENTAAAVPRVIADHRGPLLLLNQGGSKAPIFWCVNAWTEAVFLARRLDPDQPLVAMRSLDQMEDNVDKKAAYVWPLARAYTALMKPWIDSQPMVLGGYCQSGPIAEAMAHRLLCTTHRRPLLITIEYDPFYSYPGSLLMLYGAHSKPFNPLSRGINPVPAWLAMHGQPSWATLDGGHNSFFMDPVVAQTAKLITTAADRFRAGAPLTGDISGLVA